MEDQLNEQKRESKLPPLWVDQLLEWFCASHQLEEVLGDLHELYGKWLNDKGVSSADRLYFWHAIKFFRPYAIKREKPLSTLNYISMLKNYFKIAWRNLLINRLYAFLNITGLGVGLACGILILLWINHEVSFNKFHQNLSNIYLMKRNMVLNGEIQTGDATPAPLAATLRSQFPEIKYAVSTNIGGDQLIQFGKESSYAKGMYAEQDFLNIMSFPAVMGDPIAALNDPRSLVITERTAEKWFGRQDPVGKMVRLNNTHDLKIAAVVEDVPTNSTIQFDMLLPFRLYEQQHELKWDNNSFLTWIELHSNAKVNELNSKIKNLITEKLDGEVMYLFAYPFADERLYSSFKNGKPDGGKIEMVIALSFLCVFIVLIACINFMNLATARSERRSKEVGVRKVMGAQRRLIIGQFLFEALLVTFLGLVLSLILVELVIPSFNQLSGLHLELDLSNWYLWSALLLLGLITGIVAGSYPAFFLSAFQPVRVLKGVISTGKTAARLRKGLVTFQFFVSIFFIITTIVIYLQLEFIQNRPLGYDQANLIEITARGDMGKKFQVVKNDLLQIPGIKNVSAGTDNLLRMGGGLTGFKWPGKNPDEDFSLAVTWVNYDWIQTAGLKLSAGRDFSPDFGGDSLACLLNERAVHRMGLKEPVGTIVGDNYQVIGIVKDFIYNNPTADPQPMIVFLSRSNLNHFFVRFENDQDWRQKLAQIEQTIKKHNPDYPFEFHFTKDEYQRSFDEIRAGGRLTTVFSGLAIFIACLGLIGLSAFVAEQRKKEIGIRKVLGATLANISYSLSHDFVMPVVWAFILSTPVAVWAMKEMLSNMDYHIQLSWWIFALSGAMAMTIALFTVSFQSIKAGLANPTDSLRNE